MRLHELAKELGVTSKELLAQVREIGLNVKSHSSNLEAGEESILRYAMKEILDERKKKEEEEAAKKEAEKAAKSAKKASKKKTKRKTEAEADSESTADAVAVMEPEADESAAVEAGIEPAAAGETDEIATEDGAVAVEESLVKEAEAAPVAEEDSLAETTADETPVAEPETPLATKDDEGEAPPEKKEADPSSSTPAKPPLKKLKKIARRKPTATILGRIELPSAALEAHKKAKEKKRREDLPAAKRKGPEKKKESEPPIFTIEKSAKTAREKEDPAAWSDEKAKRSIKPKQAAFDHSEIEDDPLLQGIRISHWDRHYKRRRPVFRHGRSQKKFRRPAAHPDRPVDVEVPIALKDLSQLSGIKAQDILMALMKRGDIVHINSVLEEEAVLQIAMDFNREFNISQMKDEEEVFMEEVAGSEEVAEGTALPRPPIVTFLGHVDHGKTSLLDSIRKTDVVSTEEGGITQHISAYQVTTARDAVVTFLDTPGHKAFTEMRARGANATDIVVLVVAADDGVMPQTEEAIAHAKAAEVPIVVAINKVDKANANPQRVRQQLSGVEVMTEDWGGEVGCVEVSATKGTGLDELLERLALEAEILELKGNPDALASGVVLESRKDEEIGNVVTLLITDGSLKVRDTILAGEAICRVRGITDDKGRKLEIAGPSTPVNVMGFETLPESGERFLFVDDLDKARSIADLRHTRAREKRLSPDRKTITLENLFESLEAGKVTEIPVVLKADVKGSIEVLRRSFEDMAHEEVKIKAIREGVGGITEEDVLLAIASNAIILGFHVVSDAKARKLIEENKVEVKTYRVIYELLEDLRLAMEGALKPIEREIVTGHVEIRQVFKSSRLGNIGGSFVTDGVIKRNSKVRLVRDGIVIYEGDLDSLKRFKDDQREVREGFECGLRIAGYDDIKVGDTIEAFEVVEERRTLPTDSGSDDNA